MKTLHILLCLFLPGIIFSQDTFSICAIDTVTGEVGSAGASCIDANAIPGGCVVISYVQPGYGVIHTQALYTAANKAYGSALMQSGHTPQQILDSLIANDVNNNPGVRQYGIVALINGLPQVAAHTGVNCMDYKNHIQGSYYSIQGNILSGQEILDSMEYRFLHTEGSLACRLMAAMEGAKIPGADTRCINTGNSSLSSFLRVARPEDSTGTFAFDLVVPMGPIGFEPIDSLRSLFIQAGGCTGVNRENERLVVNKAVLKCIEYPHVFVLQYMDNVQLDFHLLDGLGRKVYSGKFFPGESIHLPEAGKGIYYYEIFNRQERILAGKILF